MKPEIISENDTLRAQQRVKGGCKYEIATIDTRNHAEWSVVIVRRAWNMIQQNSKTHLVHPGAEAMAVEYDPGGGAICGAESKVNNNSVALQQNHADVDGGGVAVLIQLVNGFAITQHEAILLQNKVNAFLYPGRPVVRHVQVVDGPTKEESVKASERELRIYEEGEFVQRRINRAAAGPPKAPPRPDQAADVPSTGPDAEAQSEQSFSLYSESTATATSTGLGYYDGLMSAAQNQSNVPVFGDDVGDGGLEAGNYALGLSAELRGRPAAAATGDMISEDESSLAASSAAPTATGTELSVVDVYPVGGRLKPRNTTPSRPARQGLGSGPGLGPLPAAATRQLLPGRPVPAAATQMLVGMDAAVAGTRAIEPNGISALRQQLETAKAKSQAAAKVKPLTLKEQLAAAKASLPASKP
jgi:hypothetical protein